MKIQYDKVADAMYVYVGEGKIEQTVKMDDRLVVDMDKGGHIVGIEILDASSGKGLKNLEKNVAKGIPVEIVNGALATI